MPQICRIKMSNPKIKVTHIIHADTRPAPDPELERLAKALEAEKARAKAMRTGKEPRRVPLVNILMWAAEGQRKAYKAGFAAGSKARNRG